MSRARNCDGANDLRIMNVLARGKIMGVKVKDGKSSFISELSSSVHERLLEEELLRQFSERLKMQFSHVLSDPLPGEIVRLIDGLGENNR